MINTVQCRVCHNYYDLPYSKKEYELWQGGMLIQHAMPNLEPHERELLISGTCGACFKMIFPDTDGEGEDEGTTSDPDPTGEKFEFATMVLGIAGVRKEEAFRLGDFLVKYWSSVSDLSSDQIYYLQSSFKSLVGGYVDLEIYWSKVSTLTSFMMGFEIIGHLPGKSELDQHRQEFKRLFGNPAESGPTVNKSSVFSGLKK